MAKKLNDLKSLFIHELKDLYDAENRLVDELPAMAEAATDPELQNAFRKHHEETKGHVERLESVFEKLEEKPERETCDAMKGLLKEGKEMMKEDATSDVKDAGLIAAAQRVEHYEMAGYGTIRNFARQLGREDLATILEQTLNEEKNADQTLTNVAESHVNREARV